MLKVAFVIQVVGKAGMQALVVAHHAVAQNVKTREESQRKYERYSGQLPIEREPQGGQRATQGVVFLQIGRRYHA